jgi:hypothetical protein
VLLHGTGVQTCHAHPQQGFIRHEGYPQPAPLCAPLPASPTHNRLLPGLFITKHMSHTTAAPDYDFWSKGCFIKLLLFFTLFCL